MSLGLGCEPGFLYCASGFSCGSGVFSSMKLMSTNTENKNAEQVPGQFKFSPDPCVWEANLELHPRAPEEGPYTRHWAFLAGTLDQNTGRLLSAWTPYRRSSGTGGTFRYGAPWIWQPPLQLSTQLTPFPFRSSLLTPSSPRRQRGAGTAAYLTYLQDCVYYTVL